MVKHVMNAMQASVAARRIMQRADELAQVSETPEQLTRVYLSPEHLRANYLVASWMEQVGMTTWQDAVGNICGRYEGAREGAQAVLLGSHLDTVRNAGRYDGMLGVLTALEVVAFLHEHNLQLEQAIEIVGFGDEEGTRFGITLLGSRGVTGTWPDSWLACEDAAGISVGQALVNAGFDPSRIQSAARGPEEFSAYLELHIEQGPVLERENLALGVVTAINGARRLRCRFVGEAGHAGTVPMTIRKDALAAAANWMTYIESTTATYAPDIVATVGSLQCLPGAANVIPGEVLLTLDIRSPRDSDIEALLEKLLSEAQQIAAQRGVAFDSEIYYSIPATPCDASLQRQLTSAITSVQGRSLSLPSGAGHDAIAIAEHWPVGMIFVRCDRGISHHPAESVAEADVMQAVQAYTQTVVNLASMNPLTEFNHATESEALSLITPCVAIPAWAENLVAARPYSTVDVLQHYASQLTLDWGRNELNQALSAHPRIGETAQGTSKEAALSKGEQSAVDTQNSALTLALVQGNADYEARFGRVFLIRAKGRSGEDILGELKRRLNNSPAEEEAEALEQLRQITLLRLEGVFAS
ncbi:N-carbamoyl-L-amino acid hydrolase [Buttiauxella agrestis]|uniref:N-carbamoyl-L-amino acid hydrolase n=2 Tax=Buttiauxella agrestis TaxID=82977 RepID=A0A381CBI3_9ENTR|nr:N-carbamoyl-L-amino acid hydrolase [Buttiauxella agrestis]